MKHEDFLQQAAEAKTRIKQVSPDEAETIGERSNALILDVREETEYQQQHLPKATNISLGQLEETIEEIAIDKSTPIVCYCAGGNRSAIAADTLNKMGYTNVVSIAGGLNAWESSGKDTIDLTQVKS
ncbi:MAG: rhodanese-like domain-containing protein [Cyanosarcina radialis HA8281-LM2]|jgi:rhodanese-related sulfurtransferase|nr:rhodanese-like domain-containing protein [Cyanosarcina radialis HA8281-LM2]